MKKNLFSCCLCFFTCLQLLGQNVGIGIVNPTRAKFEVVATGNTAAIFGSDLHGISLQRGYPSIGFNQYFDGTSSRYISNGYAAVQWLNTLDGNMYITQFASGFTDNAMAASINAVTVAKNGAVGIGTAPFGIARLTVARGTGGNGTAVFRGSVFASHINHSAAENTYLRGGKTGSIVYINESNNGDVIIGNPIATATSMVKVGINTATPNYALEVRQENNRGMIIVSPQFGYSNWQLRTGPQLSVGSYQLLYYGENTNPIGSWHPQTCVYAALSDERVKNEIRPLPEVGSLLSALRPVKYLVDIADARRQESQAGFIAQEVAEVLPGLITKEESPVADAEIPNMHVMNYDGLAVYAIKVIQEQEDRIRALKQRLHALKTSQLLFK